ncbi:hypothetical protein MGYG_00926 [Nannizzia gypsea CBS 118893]|uniref:Secreted protein n=1 Tax=Arthroderma gypseum (strain ATCC MYA-4604 / CBS 118893) TaxID=535722 RepID=E5R2W8_ARTGP|nr:hypothetical protein MGYG_00926 [Nannizzia gypsea CBS 118893]EFQ97889.1 hypothetical protein MGYG_00926 [Nannizzia gypsea CBS 118893]
MHKLVGNIPFGHPLLLLLLLLRTSDGSPAEPAQQARSQKKAPFASGGLTHALEHGWTGKTSKGKGGPHGSPSSRLSGPGPGPDCRCARSSRVI